MKPVKAASALFTAVLSPSLLVGRTGTVGGSSSQAQSTSAASGDSLQQTVTLKGIVDLVPHSEATRYVTLRLAK